MVKTKKLILFFLVLFLITSVSASDYSGTLTANIPAAQIEDISRAATGVLWNDGTNFNVKWMTNFDTIGTPKSFIMYSHTDCFAIGVTTFTLEDITGLYATGTIQFLNATDMHITGKQYMFLTFTSWNPTGRTGTIQSTLTIPNDGSVTSEMSDGASIFGMFGTEGIGVATMPLGGFNGGMTTGADGALYTPYPYIVKYDYTITAISGSGAGLISQIDYSKPSNNLASNFQIRKADTYTVDYEATKTDSVTGESVLHTGSNFKIVAYVPLTTSYYNTSTFFSSSPTTFTNDFSLSAIPDEVNIGQSTSIQLSNPLGMDSVNVVTYYTKDTINFEALTMFKSYRHNDDLTWSRKNATYEEYVTTTDNPFTFAYSPPTFGNKTLYAYVYNKSYNNLALISTPSTNLQVTTSFNNPLVHMYLSAIDAYTGARLSNVTLTLIDYTQGGTTNTWYNLNERKDVVLNAYDSCNLSGIQEGYTFNSINFDVPLAFGNYNDANNPPSFNQFVNVPLLPSFIPSSVLNFTFRIVAIDSVTQERLPSFKVVIPDFAITSYGNSMEELTVLVPYDKVFSISASATGYNSLSIPTNSFSPLTFRYLEFPLVKTAVIVTPTPLPTPTTKYTTKPTPQQTQGGVIVNGTFCQEPTGIFDSVTYFLCTQGFTGSSSGIILACFIMFAFSAALGILAGGNSLAFLVGALIGFVLSLGLGLIPFWILLGMLGLGILVAIVIGKGGG